MNKDQRTDLARKSLKGVSVGDAFGESFFGETNIMEKCIREKTMPQTSDMGHLFAPEQCQQQMPVELMSLAK